MLKAEYLVSTVTDKALKYICIEKAKCHLLLQKTVFIFPCMLYFT